jgi:hypothetical protein
MCADSRAQVLLPSAPHDDGDESESGCQQEPELRPTQRSHAVTESVLKKNMQEERAGSVAPFASLKYARVIWIAVYGFFVATLGRHASGL